MATAALALLSGAPTIIQGVVSLVHSIEHIFGKGNGASKKAAVLSAFQSGIQTYNATAQALVGSVKLPQMSGQMETAFGNLVDAIVAFNNASGIFPKAQ